MKLVILAGGRGSRLAEYTNKIPKPMVRINNKPIIEYIIDHFKNFGIDEVIIAGGYKHKIIKDHFKSHKLYQDIEINVINTGIKTLTGLRIKKLERHLKNEDYFFLTYGDGVSDINIKKLLRFHKEHGKIATLTAVHPPARFGELKLRGNRIKNFNEKPQLTSGWINGGFFVFKKKIFKFLSKKNVMFERETIQKLLKQNNFMAYKHTGFWMCMDTSRDKETLEGILK